MSRKISEPVTKDTQNFTVQSKYFQNGAAKKSKRYRSAFSTEQIHYLEQEFRKCPYIGGGNRKEVANQLRITERAVKIWFQNRRMKEKKEVPNNEFDVQNLINLSKESKFTSEPLNNWQINNDSRCHQFVEMKTNENNFSKKLFTQTTTNSTKLSDKVGSLSRPTFKPKQDAKLIANNGKLPTLNCVNDQAVPVVYQKIKKEPNISPAVTYNQKKACHPPAKKPVNLRSLKKSYSNFNQDMPQDLSSRTRLNKVHPQQQHPHPVNPIPGPGFIPLQIQSSYPIASLQHSNVFWKPVNMMAAIPGLPASPLSMAIPQNDAGVGLVNHNVKSNCSCNCNCHGSLSQGFNQGIRTHPQYLIAIPYSNPSK